MLKGNKVRTKLKAKQMAECDAELAAVLFSRQDKIAKDDQPVREVDAIRKRSVRLCRYLSQCLFESLSFYLKNIGNKERPTFSVGGRQREIKVYVTTDVLRVCLGTSTE